MTKQPSKNEQDTHFSETILKDLANSGLTPELTGATPADLFQDLFPLNKENARKYFSYTVNGKTRCQLFDLKTGELRAKDGYFILDPQTGFCQFKNLDPNFFQMEQNESGQWRPALDNQGNPKPVRYQLLKNSHARLYMFQKQYVNTPTSANFYTEGWKKGKLVSYLLPHLKDGYKWVILAAPGIFMFVNTPEFANLSPKGKQHVIALDADQEKNENVIKAHLLLMTALIAKGASLDRIHTLSWPETEGKGIDDYLVNQDNPVDALKTLIDQRISPVEHAKQLGYDFQFVCDAIALIASSTYDCRLTILHQEILAQHLKEIFGMKIQLIRDVLKEALAIKAHHANSQTPSSKKNASDSSIPWIFWESVEQRKGFFVPKINRKKFLEFLEQNGFGMIRIDDRIKFVRVQEQIVSENLIDHGENIDIKHFTIRYLQTHHQTTIENLMLRGHTHYFILSSLNTLPFLELNFCRDTKDTAYLFFQNGFLTVTQQTAQLLSYSQLPGYVWENQILPYEYHGSYVNGANITGLPDGEFYDFFTQITAKEITDDHDYTMNEAKFNAFLSAYGYLLYGWKDCTVAKAVICVDNMLGDIDDDGRTGKSLFCESLKYLKHVHTEPGKTWNPEERFAYQNVDVDTQIMFIDDITRRFHFKALYPSITGDLACEGKRLKRIVIPFSDSPKFVLTTNTPVKGEGASDIARQYILPFSSYFSLTYTPKDAFGHRLFVDWQDADWQAFFDFAIYALNFYLIHGLHTYIDTVFEEAKLNIQIPEQVRSFLGNLERNTPHNKEELYKSLIELGIKTTPYMLTKWMKIYCKYWKGTEENPETLRYKEQRTSSSVHGKKMNITQVLLEKVE